MLTHLGVICSAIWKTLSSLSSRDGLLPDRGREYSRQVRANLCVLIMSIGIRQSGRAGNAPISLLPVHKGGSEHPHSITPFVTRRESGLRRLSPEDHYLQQNRCRICTRRG